MFKRTSKKKKEDNMQGFYTKGGYYIPLQSGWSTITKMWTTKGISIRPEEMDTKHLKNVLAFLSRIEVDKRDASWLDAMNYMQSEYNKRNSKTSFTSLPYDKQSSIIRGMLTDIQKKSQSIRGVRLFAGMTYTQLLCMAVTSSTELRYNMNENIKITLDNRYVEIKNDSDRSNRSVKYPVKDQLHTAFVVLNVVGGISHPSVENVKI